MSIYDRDYMGNYGGARRVSVSPLGGDNALVKIIILINVACFILGAFVDRFAGYGTFWGWFELSTGALAHGKVWTVFTYSFLHADLLHIVCNMLALYFMGTPLVKWIGPRRFAFVYFGGALAGAALWLAVSYLTQTFGGAQDIPVIGASASVMAVFACFCAVYPPVPITFLLFFVLPISLKPMTMLKIAAAIEVTGLVYELSGGSISIAYGAHLGGMVFGLLSAFSIKRGGMNFLQNMSFRKIFPKKSDKNLEGKKAESYSFKVNITNPDELRKEVNRILDKINTGGFSTLSEDERETLKKAKNYLK